MTSLLERHDLLLADLDGTLYRGREAVPGAVEAVRRAGERGVRTVYVTNNASRSPAEVAAHLAELGFPAGADDVATSSQAAATVLADQLPAGAKVLVVGTAALAEEVSQVGLTPVDAADGAVAVVQGLDPQLRYATLAEATVALRAGAVWVACNVDPTLPSERGPLPGNGALVAVLRTATRLEPQVAGKPAPALMRTAAQRVGATTPLVVGDRLDTDIQGANAAGMPSALVLTGIDGPKELLAAQPHARPGFILGDLRGLLEPYPEVKRRRDGVQVGKAVARVDGVSLEVVKAGEPIDLLRAASEAVWSSPVSAYALRIPDSVLGLRSSLQ
jgi:glycerol-1-phosphatase